MVPDPQDTIVALSSAAGPGGRAIVRVCGPDAFAVVERVCPTPEPPPAGERRLLPGDISLPGIASPLPADFYFWHAPRTYTGQDLVEIHTLSSPPLIDLLIARLLDAGARAAGPGEFTMRAFLAGKLDLTQAEAVLGVLEAGTRDELTQALTQLAGGIGKPLHELREDLLNLLADTEAGLDFADEDIQFVEPDELLRRISRGMAQVTLLQKQLNQRSLGDRPFRAVLVGQPNAGKSSLLNALAGSPAALVSPEAGTTRDYLVKSVNWDDLAIELIDTAGRRVAQGAIEDQAQLLAGQQAERADLLLVCVEGGEALDPELEAFVRRPGGPPVVPVATKCDLREAGPVWLATSAVSGRGLDLLKEVIADKARTAKRSGLAPSLGRCRHLVAACLEHLRNAHGAVLFHDPAEILALELRGALDQLGQMVGAVYTDDLLDRIFSRFCIGK